LNRFLQDILDQPYELKHVLNYSLKEQSGNIRKAASMIKESERVVLTSMGSAIFSLMPMQSLLSKLHPNCQIIETSELLVNNPFSEKTLYIIMSRSGESGEIAEFAKILKSGNHDLIAITMTTESTLAKNAVLTIHDPASYDGFICTKAYTSMALQGLLVASQMREGLTENQLHELHKYFDWLENNKLTLLDKVTNSPVLQKPSGIYFLSHGPGLAIARVGQLYTEEAARIISSHSSFGLFHHGPVEQIDERFNGIWIDLDPDERTRELFVEANVKNGNLMVVSIEGDFYQSEFLLPKHSLDTEYSCIGAAMIVQMAAYQISVSLGLDPGSMRYCNWVIK
jgi:glucosamine 6-phosphate synthetase-like amidotransferase/phosphosugar isomerase protein